jgi:hypothetical protein
MLPALINIAVAALILILLVWFVWVVRKFALKSLEKIGTRLDSFPKVVGGLRSQIIQGLQSLVRLVAPGKKKSPSHTRFSWEPLPRNTAASREIQGMVVTVSVTIGYDVPWRQVHALLLLGAARTRGIRSEPAPRVLQRELSDFYVQYHLMAHLREGENWAEVISELRAQIQDAFNEFGAQIMSPHFESQPEKRVFVPKPQWHTAPASPPPISDEGNRKPASRPNSQM